MADNERAEAQAFPEFEERLPRAVVLGQAAEVESHPFLPRLLDALPDAVLLLNSRRQIVFANREMQRVLGDRPREAIVGLRPGEALGCAHAGDGPREGGTSPACRFCGALAAFLESQRAAARACRSSRLLCAGADGPRAYDALVVATPVTLDGHTFTLLVLRDREAEWRRAVLDGVLFHDALNLAGALQGLVQLLMAERRERARGLLNRLRHITGRLVATLREHRDFAAAERGQLQAEPESVPVAAVLSELATLYTTHPVSARRRIRRAFQVPADACVWANRNLLLRVLGNLLKNALEATRPGGTVTVTAEAVEGGRVRFGIHNARAMPPEVQAQVFQRSFSTKGDPGRGLGTFSAKLLTERYLRGEIGFTSTEAEGTTFTVTLPAARRIASVAQGGTETRLDGVSILLADDDPDSRWLGLHLLESAGATVKAVSDGVEVLAAVQAGERFDLVLLDMRMARMDGIATVRALRERGYTGALVALTASGRIAADVWRASGGDAWLDKTLDPPELLAALGELVSVRRCLPRPEAVGSLTTGI